MRVFASVLLALLIVEEAWAQAGDGRVSVRRIEFVGAAGMSDGVLRRRMLQLEGTHVNTTALRQSA